MFDAFSVLVAFTLMIPGLLVVGIAVYHTINEVSGVLDINAVCNCPDCAKRAKK